MKTRGTPTRLELHRLKFHQSGKRGPMLVASELTEEEKDILNRAVAMDVRVKDLEFCGEMDERIYDSVQAEVYSDWGVMCPHYVEHTKAKERHPICVACGAVLFLHVTRREIRALGTPPPGKVILE